VASRLLGLTRVGDLEQLLSRDHAELDRYVRLLISITAFERDWWLALDGARLAFAAHAEATERLLGDLLASTPTLRGSAIDKVLAAHRAQEQALQRLMQCSDPLRAEGDTIELRALLLTHDEHHRLLFSPALRRALTVPEYERLAGRYATERVRALSQLWGCARSPAAAVT
jgi:hypothetical protein